jgi:hypothetical protein
LLRGVANIRAITHLSIACEKTPPRSLPLRPCLLKLIQNTAIEFLDVSGQPIGEATIFAILDAADHLIEFQFDRTAVTNCEALNAVARRVLEKKSLKYVSFPRSELSLSLTLSPPMARVRLQWEALNLWNKFSARFENHPVGYSDLARFTRHETAVLGPQVSESEITRCTRPGEAPVPRPPISESFAIMIEFVEHEPEVLALLEECGGVLGEEPMERVDVEARMLIDIRTLADKLPVTK